MKTNGNILIARDVDELIGEFIDIFCRLYSDAVAEKGTFTVSLSGGSTPKAIYQRLAAMPIDWGKVFFFFGDERCVPPDDDESNFRMASETILDPLGISEERVFRWRTELQDPGLVAADYERRLTGFFGDSVPRFDLFLLGLGADAHTASLFPGTDALYETERYAVANWVPKFNAFRLTLTPFVINNAANVFFIATGGEKAKAVAAVLSDDYDPERLPAQLIDPKAGKVKWLIDEASAAALDSV